MAAGNVNRIRNPAFSEGKAAPRSWVWKSSGKGVRWHRGLRGGPVEAGGITIGSDRAEGTGVWSQVVVCKPGTYYRIEATVTADLIVTEDVHPVSAAGVVLSVQPMADNRPVGQGRVTPGLHRSSRPIAVRTYYRAPDGIRRLRVSVGVVRACGTASIHHVRFIEILEPEETSHMLAIPAPSHTVPVPRVARSVCICSATAVERRITRLFAAHLGEANVHTETPGNLHSHGVLADALLLPDADPPRSIRSLPALMKITKQQIVVMSLPAFAKLAKGTLRLRRVEQDDDPICAKVAFTNHATRGFALHDVFAYAWAGKTPGSFVQNHYRKTVELKEFCEKQGFVTLLESVCDRDVTSDRPVCLYKQTPGGGLFVLDVEPVEAEGSTFGEPALAMYLLLSMLGRAGGGLGRYVVPVEMESDFRGLLRETSCRFEPFVVHDSGLPVEEVREQLVTIGREDKAFGSPLAARPCILVRSGLVSGDMESVYGAFVWFKQYVRMEPYRCPYAEQLASQFRLAWIPCAAPWEMRNGWWRSGRSAVETRTGIPDASGVALLVDVVSVPENAVSVVLPKREGGYRRFAEWLPQLAATLLPGRFFMPGVDDGHGFCDRDRFEWRELSADMQLVVDPKAFRSGMPREVIAAGGRAVRIEIPGSDADFTAYSIQRTGLAATLLELVIGLQYGLIAVNRTPTAVHFDGFSPIGTGEALIIDRRDPMLRADASQAG